MLFVLVIANAAKLPASLCASQPQRLAILVAGQCRTFSEPLLQGSLINNVLNSRETESTRVFASFTDLPCPSGPCMLGIQRMNATYAAPRFERFNPHCPLAGNQYDWGNSTQTIENHLLSVISAVRTAFDLLRAHESSTGWVPHFVMRIRPDLLVYRPWTSLCLYDMTMKAIYHHHIDFAMLAPRPLAEGAFDLASAYRDCRMPGGCRMRPIRRDLRSR